LKRILLALALTIMAIVAGGCSLIADLGDEPVLRPPGSAGSAGAAGAGGAAGTGGSSGADAATDANAGPDATEPDTATPDTAAPDGPRDGGADAPGDRPIADTGSDGVAGSCTNADNGCSDPNTLRICNAGSLVITNCPAGCSVTGGPHCQVLYPTLPVTRTDLAMPNLGTVTFPAGETRINVDNGAISGAFTRAANIVTTNTEVAAGIAFHQAGAVSVFTFGTLTVPKGATVKLIGANAVALVSQSNLFVYGVIDARPMDAAGVLCALNTAGPSGGVGGLRGMMGPVPRSGAPGAGPGAGGGGTLAVQGNPGGGGGAGHARVGGVGASGCHLNAPANPGGSAGTAYAGLGGGSGGGGGGLADGGGGGGSVRLVAGNVITIGDGTSIQGVNVGGCGGKAGRGGGGGGSGGAISLEAPFIQLGALGTLAANGGGGGGSPNNVDGDGQPGQLSATPAYGVGSTMVSPLAGNGGAGDAPQGTPPAGSGCGIIEGLGGGGSAGRIQILSKGNTPTLHVMSVLSPSIMSAAATTAMADVH
jgi:hypothetical protein